jgi:metallo-beta-lactamase family protein
MHVTCLGAARTVTGSSFLITLDDQRCFLVDCGMFQGGRQIEMRNYSTGSYRVPDLEGIFITHAHIDHSGLVPRLVREGFRGPVFGTEATCDLLKILWLDSAHIQEMEAEWQTRKNKRKGRRGIEPLYETVDAETAIRLLRPVDIDVEQSLLPAVNTKFVTAGHILGAAGIHFNLSGRNGPCRVGFSGDLGRPGQLIIPDAEKLPPVDMLFMESTYGNRRHKTLVESQNELIDVVGEAYREGGKVIIPAFAVERTQEIIYTLARAHEQGRIPDDMPIFLDSPLAIQATLIFRKHPDFFDEATLTLLDDGKTPMNLPNLKFTPKTQDSQAINEHKGPAIIIAGSGMANAGRIKHHLKHNLWKSNCHVVIVGFQAKGTTGRQLVEGASKVKIFREDVAVMAKIHTIGGFSAHADQAELLDWLDGQVHAGLQINLMHGEESVILAFQRLAQERYPEATFHVPRFREMIPLQPGPAAETLPDQWAERRHLLETRIRRVEERLISDRQALTEDQVRVLESALAQVESALNQVGA